MLNLKYLEKYFTLLFHKIYEIKEIQISILKSNPPKLGIIVIGSTITSGWTNPTLTQYMYFIPPEDGIWDFDFIADEPQGISAQVITPIMASLTWNKDLKQVKGIRIHASSNTQTKMLDDPNNKNIIF